MTSLKEQIKELHKPKIFIAFIGFFAWLVFMLFYFHIIEVKAYPSIVNDITVIFSELGDVALTITVVVIAILILAVWTIKKQSR